MSLPRLSTVPEDLSSLSEKFVQHVSVSTVLVPEDQACASDDIRTCISVNGLCSGIKNIGRSSDNPAVVSKYRTSSILHTITQTPGIKGAAASKSQPAVSEKTMYGGGNKSLKVERKQSPECSMCGDIGLRKQLFRCCKCQYRFQHTYCSNWYPKKRSYAGICNWCDTRADERRRKQSKQSGHDCATSHTKFHTAREVDNSKTKLRKLCNKTHRSDHHSKARNSWKNELEMLLDAAAVTTEAGLGSDSGNEVASLTDLRRSKSLPQTVQPSNEAKSTGLKCKEPSSLAKKIGRRYKFVLDVY